MRKRALIKSVCICAALVLSAPVHAAWYRGNTHTHSLNSDGNVAPDDVVRWYREHGYQFVVMTEHEYITDVAPLQAIFGANEQFLVMQGQEITQSVRDPKHPDGERQAHVNAINSNRLIIPMTSEGVKSALSPRVYTVSEKVSIAETYARNLGQIREAGGVGQVNHPNFRWSVRMEDMLDLPDNTLFELWNGQLEINNLGGTDDAGNKSLSTEALWDALLSRGKRLWGVAVDDSHGFKNLSEPNGAMPGQAWVVVRADRLAPDMIAAALAKGDFYSSTGVALDDLTANEKEISIKIKNTVRPGVVANARFVTRFIGRDGRVLAEITGTQPKYAIRGDEGYVRAAIMDSNGRRAWTQPVYLSGKR